MKILFTAKLKFSDVEQVDEYTLLLYDDKTEICDEEYFQVILTEPATYHVRPGASDCLLYSMGGGDVI